MRLTVLAFLALLFFACTSDRAQEWTALDLTRYNVPLTIQAPDSAKINATTFSGLMQDVTIKSAADDYSIQVLASQAATNEMSRLLAEQLTLVRDNRYFESIVREEADGFIFQNRIDTTTVYGFRYIVYQGDQEFVFQNSFDGIFGLPEIEAMYAAVKQD